MVLSEPVKGIPYQGRAVTLSGLEASWEKIEPDKLLWHGTAVSAVEGIASKGLLPQKRSHVHLASSIDSRVGKRSNVRCCWESVQTGFGVRGSKSFEAPMVSSWFERSLLVVSPDCFR